MVYYLINAIAENIMLLCVLVGVFFLLHKTKWILYMGNSKSGRVDAVGSFSLFPWFDALKGDKKADFFSRDKGCFGSVFGGVDIENTHFAITDRRGLEITKFHIAHAGSILFGYISLANAFLRAGAMFLAQGKIDGAEFAGNLHLLTHGVIFCASMLIASAFNCVIADITKKTDAYIVILKSIYVFFKGVCESDLRINLNFMDYVLSALQFNEDFELLTCVKSIQQEPTAEQGREILKRILSAAKTKTADGTSCFFELSNSEKSKFLEIERLVNAN